MYIPARAFVACGLILSSVALGAEPLVLSQPQAHQVLQRIGVGRGKVLQMCISSALCRQRLSKRRGNIELSSWQISRSNRQRLIPSASGRAYDSDNRGDTFQAAARVPAGGWYRLECRCRIDDNVLAIGGLSRLVWVKSLWSRDNRTPPTATTND
jgi:hypothetical protein